MRLTNLFEAESKKSKRVVTPARVSAPFNFNEWESKIGNDVRLDFPIRNSTFGKYLSSSLIYGTLEKIDRKKNLFVIKIEEMNFNDETISGGPSGEVKNYKMAFDVDDIESIGKYNSLIEITMKP